MHLNSQKTGQRLLVEVGLSGFLSLWLPFLITSTTHLLYNQAILVTFRFKIYHQIII